MNRLQNDAPIDKVREVRHMIPARCNHDPTQLVDYYLKLQQQYKYRLLKPADKKDVGCSPRSG